MPEVTDRILIGGVVGGRGHASDGVPFEGSSARAGSHPVSLASNGVPCEGALVRTGSHSRDTLNISSKSGVDVQALPQRPSRRVNRSHLHCICI